MYDEMLMKCTFQNQKLVNPSAGLPYVLMGDNNRLIALNHPVLQHLQQQQQQQQQQNRQQSLAKMNGEGEDTSASAESDYDEVSDTQHDQEMYLFIWSISHCQTKVILQISIQELRDQYYVPFDENILLLIDNSIVKLDKIKF